MRDSLCMSLTEAQATEDGEALLAMMEGECWELKVHENFGWHYYVQKGGMTVTFHNNYSCLFSSDGKSCGGDMFWTPDDKNYDNPNDAVKAQIKVSIAFIHKCQNALQPFIEWL